MRTKARAAAHAGTKALICAAHKGGTAGDAYSLRQKDARLLYSNLVSQDAASRRREWELEEQRHPRASRVVQHLSLSRPPGQDLDDAGWRRVAEAWLEKVGAKGCSYILVKHDHQGAPHVHLIWSRSRPDGRLVDTRHNYRRWSAAADQVAQELGLEQPRQADAQALRELEARPRSTPAMQAARRAARRGTVDPWIDPVIVREAVARSTTAQELQQHLAAAGIDLLVRHDGAGQATGILLKNKHAAEALAGSSVAREFSLPRIQAQLQANAEEAQQAASLALQRVQRRQAIPIPHQHPRERG